MRSLEDLKARSKPALAYPDLIQIARQATVTKAYDDALESLRQICDSEKTQDLARACRFLAIIRRDYGEEFEKFVSENQRRVENKKENAKVETEITNDQQKEVIIDQQRTVKLRDGSKMRIKSSLTDNLWGFKVDDVICIQGPTYDDNTKAVVLGFNDMPDLVILIEKEDFARTITTVPNCLSLLERKGLKIKVGEQINVVPDKSSTKSVGGIVKVINPYTEHFLVEYRNQPLGEGIIWEWFSPDSIRADLNPKRIIKL